MTIERNEASFDWRKAAEYNGATNADWFAGFPPGSCKLEMTADERVQGDIVYVRVRYEIAVNLTVDWQNNPLGWDVELLNKGSRGLGPEMLGTKVHYAEADRQTGAICAFEYLLDLDGNMLPKDSHGRKTHSKGPTFDSVPGARELLHVASHEHAGRANQKEVNDASTCRNSRPRTAKAGEEPGAVFGTRKNCTSGSRRRPSCHPRQTGGCS